jgi:hypothetical protein
MKDEGVHIGAPIASFVLSKLGITHTMKRYLLVSSPQLRVQGSRQNPSTDLFQIL